MRDRNSLRICIVLPVHWRAFMGGAQYQAKFLIERLIEAKTFETFYLAKRIAPAYAPSGYRVQAIGGSRIGAWLGVPADGLSLYRTLKQVNPDVVYQRVGGAYTGVCAHYARQYGRRMIWHVAHDKDLVPGGHLVSNRPVAGYLDGALLEYGIRHAGQIVTQTKTQAALLASNYGREADAVIPNFHPAPTEELNKDGAMTVVWIGNMKVWKRPEVFIDMARDLSQMTSGSDMRFVVIGAPAQNRQRQLRLVESMGSVPNLMYKGAVGQEEVNEILASAHILVNTSQYEGFSNTWIQAWMREVPVVSLELNPDGVFDDQKVGICAGSYDRLVKTLSELAEDRRRLDVMGKEAARYAASHHGMENADRLLELFEAIPQTSEVVGALRAGRNYP